MNATTAANCPFNDPEVLERAAAARRNSPAWLASIRTANENRSPEWLGNLRLGLQNRDQAWRDNAASATVTAHAKHYVFRSPEGERVEVYNLKAFCRERSLSDSAMGKVAAGTHTQHKGWTRYEE